MVLDSKQMEWASRQGLETAALKKAKVPIFGKWYFPDLPANEPLINLSTGEVETFPSGFRAGAILYVKEADLKRAGIGPYKAAPAAPTLTQPAATAAAAAEPAAVAAPAAAAVTAAPSPTPASAPAAHTAPAAPAHGGGHATPATAAHATGAHTSVAMVHGGHATGEHAHPGPKQYVVIAVILCIITAIEVWVYYIPALLPYIFPILSVLSIAKFAMVVGWFMHLKFDHASFTWYFGGGLALALSIATAVVLMQIGTHGLPPGDGNAHVYPPSMAAPGSAPQPAGGH